MTAEVESKAYVMELADCLQSGHECAPGHWWHAWSEDKSQEQINALIDRLFAHCVGCSGVAEPVRQHLAAMLDRARRG